jgi:hypothetical protein
VKLFVVGDWRRSRREPPWVNGVANSTVFGGIAGETMAQRRVRRCAIPTPTRSRRA